MFRGREKKLEERVDALEKVSSRPIIQIECSGRNVGENIRIIRSERGIAQKALAEAVGISQPMMTQIERGSKVPNIILAKDISRVLGCDLNDLVGG